MIDAKDGIALNNNFVKRVLCSRVVDLIATLHLWKHKWVLDQADKVAYGCKMTQKYNCYVLNDRDDLGKFEPKSDESIFIGYSHNLKAFRVFNKRTRTILESSNVDFSETETYFVASPSNVDASFPELFTTPPSTDSSTNSFALDFIDLADYDLPTLTGPIVVPAHAGSTTTSVTSDAFITEPSSSTSTNSVTPESAVSPLETSSAASPKPV
ncbi:hypothetical protein OSB04_000748 [Centaurea solstitialis]|uniref:Retroviral polymerase SH3-like domain-containing protein n=1 Tax=Centaurea solstitialis TaxID=347529 RepID=A0AA38WKU3_9ASTR|nr:hypothetical protein OSB04_000748 [Centaurea solstitialis]